MPIALHMKYSPKKIDEKHLSTIIDEIFSSLRFDEIDLINVILVDNAQIRDLNRRFLNRDGLTDCITFPYKDNSELTGNNTFADIFISSEVALNQSIRQGHSYQREILHLTVHSLLHLLGWEDDTEEKRDNMDDETERIIDDTLDHLNIEEL